MDNKKKLLRLLKNFFVIAGMITALCFRIPSYAASTGVIGDIIDKTTDNDDENTNVGFNEEDFNETVYDESGYCTSGHFQAVDEGSDYYKKWTVGFNCSCTDGYFLYMTTFMGNYTLHVVDSEGNNMTTGFPTDSIKLDTFSFTENNDGTNSVQNATEQNTYSVNLTESAVVSCTIPIFDELDNEAISLYINDGDTSGAKNKDDLSTKDDTYDSTIEPPRGLKTSGSFPGISYNPVDNTIYYIGSGVAYTWNYPADVENYKYDIQIRYKVRKELSGGYEYTDWYNYVKSFSYSTQYDLTTGEAVAMDGLTHTEVIAKGEFQTICSKQLGINTNNNLQTTFNGRYIIDGIEFRVRHRKGDGYSSWVDVTSDSTGNKSYLTDPDGDWVGDDEYTGSNSDSEFDITKSGGLDVTSFTSYIKSGFGLLGNYGLISLMSGLFSYVPASVWDLIKTGIAAMIIVLLIGTVVTVITNVIGSIGGIKP